MTSKNFDTIVVGGGSGGLAYAKRAASLGASVAMIEKAELGGTCVNRGCVPKKLMWEAGRTAMEARRMAKMDLSGELRIDMARLRDLSDKKIAGLHDTFEDQLSDTGVTLIRGNATIGEPEGVEVEGKRFETTRLVLATGALPQRPEFPGADLAAVSSDVFAWRSLPTSIVILGGGYIGCEFAAIFSALGCQVTLIEPSDRLLDTFFAPLAEHAGRALLALGVDVVTGKEPSEINRSDDAFTVTCRDGASFTAQKVLAATGRAPRVDDLGGIADRLELADSGAIAVGPDFQTSCKGVYAIGDAADRLPLTPVATRDGETLADQLFGQWRDPIDLDLVATTAFLYPPHAQVGRPDGAEPTCGTPLRGGVTAGEDKVADLDFHALSHIGGRLVGAALAFDGAEETIAALGALIAAGCGKDALRAATGVHPTPAEEILGR